MNNNNKDYISISDISKIIKYTIEGNPELRSVYLKGEISNIKYHSRGHLYFSLKDENAKINAIMFNYKNNLNFEPQDGDAVLVHGRISIFEGNSGYQIYVDEIELDGQGNLYVLFEQLKKKLYAEGLFDPAHKLPIKRMPKKIGVITAPTGAAVKDIISTINKRYPFVEILLFPTLVQGPDAASNIVKMIELANTYNDIDTIILGRGGGSIEDLWAFNEEIVARAIYNSHIPIISGVGHEPDITITDYVADKRAPTPTGAATLCVPDKADILTYIKEANKRIISGIKSTVDKKEKDLRKYKENFIIKNPKSLYEMKEQKIDIYIDKLSNIMTTKLERAHHNLDKLSSSFILKHPENIIENKNKDLTNLKTKTELLNPFTIMNKGYSAITVDGHIVKDATKLKENDKIKIIASKAVVSAVVEGVQKNG